MRTRGEIDMEKFALKYLRGDFEPVLLASREGRLSVEILSEAVRRLD